MQMFCCKAWVWSTLLLPRWNSSKNVDKMLVPFAAKCLRNTRISSAAKNGCFLTHYLNQCHHCKYKEESTANVGYNLYQNSRNCSLTDGDRNTFYIKYNKICFSVHGKVTIGEKRKRKRERQGLSIQVKFKESSNWDDRKRWFELSYNMVQSNKPSWSINKWSQSYIVTLL